jgi:hypothetical protein
LDDPLPDAGEFRCRCGWVLFFDPDQMDLELHGDDITPSTSEDELKRLLRFLLERDPRVEKTGFLRIARRGRPWYGIEIEVKLDE